MIFNVCQNVTCELILEKALERAKTDQRSVLDVIK